MATLNFSLLPVIRKHYSIILILLLLIIHSCQSPDKSGKNPLTKLDGTAIIEEWLVSGPITIAPDSGETIYDLAPTILQKDFLTSLGGEEKAEFTAGQEILIDEGDTMQTLTVIPLPSDENGIVNLHSHYPDHDGVVIYGYGSIKSPVEQKAWFAFGSDDDAKVWVNGLCVYEYSGGRGLIPGQDDFSVILNKGVNNVLVKVVDRRREMGFAIKVFDEETFGVLEAQKVRKSDYRRFLNCRLKPSIENPWEYFFTPGRFPEIVWDQPELVEKLHGSFPIHTQWYNSDQQEVEEAEGPGRYAFISTGTTENGLKIIRGGTVYCFPWDWYGWNEKIYAEPDYFPEKIISKSLWDDHIEAIAVNTGRLAQLSMLRQEEGAILLSFLNDVERLKLKASPYETPVIRDSEYHLSLKRKMLNLENKWKPLKPPSKIMDQTAPVLKSGNDLQAGFTPGTSVKIRSLCKEWADESGEPFDLLIARNGSILIHEAFGENELGKKTIHSPQEIASITKLVTAMIFAQFVDQGLIEIDEPVGNFIEGFPVEGEKVITFRHCFTHTTGLYGHEDYQGLHNPWFENVISNYIEYLEPGKTHEYNGMGYDLAGRVMEIITGKSIFRIAQENLFVPLGMNETYLAEDLAFSTFSTAYDMALLGQMLLNKGQYKNKAYFGPETYQQLLPQPLNTFYPELDVDWGIGLTGMNVNDDQWKPLLSDKIIGHGSATSAILNIDPENGIVITQSRKIGGPKYYDYLVRLYSILDQEIIHKE